MFVLEGSKQKGDLQEKSRVDAGESLVLPYYLTTYFRYIKKVQVGRYLGTNAYLLYGMADSHTRKV